MKLTKEELMIPRVLVIGGKEGEPNDTSGDFISGDILTQTVKSIHKWRSEKLKHSVYLDPNYIEKFPHLFNPLQWWEFRAPEDMPKYLKFSYTDEPVIHKVKKWVKDKHFGCVADCGFGGFSQVMNEYISPATCEEYAEYKKQKEAQS